jgi:predicted alpha/beta hydrolase family esterase
MRLTAAALRNQGHQVWYPQFPSPETPDPKEWQDLLRQESNMMDEVEGEKICIAHSLGTTNWLIGALNDIYQKPFDRVLLVAPPDPEMTSQAEGIKGDPLDLTNPSLETQAKKWAKSLAVIASENDKWLPRGVQIYGEALQVKPVILQGAGHFSLDDGWGNWLGVQRWIESGDTDLILER